MNYIVGDIQGCYLGLKALLKKVRFKPHRDQLWAVGDLVARGEDSLSTLQYLFELGDSFKSVLGNHDLHLLSIANGLKNPKPSDKLDALLNDKDINKYVDWLRTFPLARKIDSKTLLCHAGLYPQWSIDDALDLSLEVQNKLKRKDYPLFLKNMYSSQSRNWQDAKNSTDRQVFIVDAMTRMRYLSAPLELDFKEKNSPDHAPSHLFPWFAVKNPRLTKKQRIVFGHWASLCGQTKKSQFIGLDTGFVWGGQMSCLCAETNMLYHVDAQQ